MENRWEGSRWDCGEPGQGLRGAPGAMTGVGTPRLACRSGDLALSVGLAAEGKSPFPQFSDLTAHAQCRGFGQAKISKDSLPARRPGPVTGRALCLFFGGRMGFEGGCSGTGVKQHQGRLELQGEECLQGVWGPRTPREGSPLFVPAVLGNPRVSLGLS